MTGSPAGPTVAPIGSVAAPPRWARRRRGGAVVGGGCPRRSRPPSARSAGVSAGVAAAGTVRRDRLTTARERDLSEVETGAVGERLHLLDQARRVVVARDRLAEDDEAMVVLRVVALGLLRVDGQLLLRGDRSWSVGDVLVERGRLLALRRDDEEPEGCDQAHDEQADHDRAVARLHRATPVTTSAACWASPVCSAAELVGAGVGVAPGRGRGGERAAAAPRRRRRRSRTWR